MWQKFAYSLQKNASSFRLRGTLFETWTIDYCAFLRDQNYIAKNSLKYDLSLQAKHECDPPSPASLYNAVTYILFWSYFSHSTTTVNHFAQVFAYYFCQNIATIRGNEKRGVRIDSLERQFVILWQCLAPVNGTCATKSNVSKGACREEVLLFFGMQDSWFDELQLERLLRNRVEEKIIDRMRECATEICTESERNYRSRLKIHKDIERIAPMFLECNLPSSLSPAAINPRSSCSFDLRRQAAMMMKRNGRVSFQSSSSRICRSAVPWTYPSVLVVSSSGT